MEKPRPYSPTGLIWAPFFLGFVVLFAYLVFAPLSTRRNSGREVSEVKMRIAANLQRLQSAKQAWALQHSRTGAVVVTEQDLRPYLGNRADAVTPAIGERYSINVLSEAPEAVLTRAWKSLPKGTRFRFSVSNSFEILPPEKDPGAGAPTTQK